MLLRWLVGNYLRQSAESAVQGALRSAASLARTAPEHGPIQIPDHYRIAVVFALGIESSGLLSMLSQPATLRGEQSTEYWGPLDDRPVRVVESGTGSERAEAATTELIARCRPAWIVSAGFAAALQAGTRHGDIVMADRVLDDQGRELRVPFRVSEQVAQSMPRLRIGPLVTLPRVLTSPEERRAAADRYSAVAADQETMGVARTCQRERVKFLSVRVITDTIDDLLPPEIVQWMQRKSVAGKLGVAAGTVFKRPAAVKELWHLRDEASAASRHLAQFLVGAIPQLPLDDRPG